MASATYVIVVRGRLGGALARWFEDLDVRASGPDSTQLSGRFADQAALQGLLGRLSDLGLELSAVQRVPDDE